MSWVSIYDAINKSRGTTRIVIVAAVAAAVGVLLAMDAPTFVPQSRSSDEIAHNTSIEHRLKNLEEGQARLERNAEYLRNSLDRIREHLMGSK